MKKYVKLVPYIVFVTLSGSAFAQSNLDNSLEAVFSKTDAQLASSMNSAAAQYQPAALPVPVLERAAAGRIQLIDITDKSIQNYEVVSAYPVVYKMFSSRENSRIIKVFSFADTKGIERRIEVYYTGDDWMQYGFTYIVTNAGADKDQARAYQVADLSTPDSENGVGEPKVNPFDAQKLTEFISTAFLDAAGNVKASFGSIAAAPVSVK